MIVICYFLPFLCVSEEKYEGCIVKTGHHPQPEINLYCNETKTQTISLSPEIVKWNEGSKYKQCLAGTRNLTRVEADFICEKFRPKVICDLHSILLPNVAIGIPCNPYRSSRTLETTTTTTTIKVEKTSEEKMKSYKQCKINRNLKKFGSFGHGQIFSGDPCKKLLE